MAETNPVQSGANNYDDTIVTPEHPDTQDTADPNPLAGQDVDDTPPAGEQPPADGALDADGTPVRAEGTLARDKGQVS